MKVEINIDDYLTQDEIKQAIKDAIGSHVRSLVGEKDYTFVQKLANSLAKQGAQELVPNFEEKINEHIQQLIESITLGDLFFQSFGWRSEGNKVFTNILKRNESLIEEKIKTNVQ